MYVTKLKIFRRTDTLKVWYLCGYTFILPIVLIAALEKKKPHKSLRNEKHQRIFTVTYCSHSHLSNCMHVRMDRQTDKRAIEME